MFDIYIYIYIMFDTCQKYWKIPKNKVLTVTFKHDSYTEKIIKKAALEIALLLSTKMKKWLYDRVTTVN